MKMFSFRYLLLVALTVVGCSRSPRPPASPPRSPSSSSSTPWRSSSARLSRTLGALPSGAGSSATLNYQLTNYAVGLFNDAAEVLALSERLAPTTPVPGAVGQFKTFEDKNSFMPEKTARARGGDPTIIDFGADSGTTTASRRRWRSASTRMRTKRAGSEGGEVGIQLLDQGKIRALVNKTLLSHAVDVSTYVLANTTALAGQGVWSDPTIDPIDQLNAQLLALSLVCGSTQNIKITMDPTAWNALRTHPKVKARALFGAASSLASVSIAQVVSALLFPVDLAVLNVVYDTARLAQAAVKARLISNVVFIHYSVPDPTVYDPSAFKVFTVGQSALVAAVRSYQSLSMLWRAISSTGRATSSSPAPRASSASTSAERPRFQTPSSQTEKLNILL